MALKSLYENQFLPRLIHVLGQGKEIRKLRREALAEAKGVVLEIGFGSGLTLPFYSNAVTRVLAVEPSMTARKLARKNIRRAPFPVEYVGLEGEKIALPDASVDTAVSILTLCTIPGVEQALKEISRVLKPGGAFLFLEHGASPDPRVRTWQNRLDPIQGKLFGGCHLNRPIAELVRGAGLQIDRLSNEYIKGMPRPMAYGYKGLARR
jgi:ubiquinone/menaquinone biosynthesis C-methylase UbiE